DQRPAPDAPGLLLAADVHHDVPARARDVRAEVPHRDADVEGRRERAAGDLAHRLAAREHRAPWTRDAGLEQLHHDQALGRALRLAPPALLDAEEPAL